MDTYPVVTIKFNTDFGSKDEQCDCACVSKEGYEQSVNTFPLITWLHLTDRCNFRCSYCYLPHVREDMSPETGRAAIDATFRSALANGFKQQYLRQKRDEKVGLIG